MKALNRPNVHGRKEKNYWKMSAMILIVLILGLTFLDFSWAPKEEMLHYEGFEIKQSNFDKLSNVMIEQGIEEFYITDVKSGRVLRVTTKPK